MRAVRHRAHEVIAHIKAYYGERSSATWDCRMLGSTIGQLSAAILPACREPCYICADGRASRAAKATPYCSRTPIAAMGYIQRAKEEPAYE